MTVRLTRIYTKTGDAGETHLGDMSRVAKTDPRLAAFADVDEANSALGVALALGQPEAAVADLLRSVQNDLFDVGADLCTPVTPDPGVRSYSTPQPSRRSTSLMIETSRMSGTSSIVVRPVASNAAAMSLSALFLAPVTRTRPVRAVPPATSKHSTGSP